MTPYREIDIGKRERFIDDPGYCCKTHLGAGNAWTSTRFDRPFLRFHFFITRRGILSVKYYIIVIRYYTRVVKKEYATRFYTSVSVFTTHVGFTRLRSSSFLITPGIIKPFNPNVSRISYNGHSAIQEITNSFVSRD